MPVHKNMSDSKPLAARKFSIAALLVAATFALTGASSAQSDELNAAGTVHWPVAGDIKEIALGQVFLEIATLRETGVSETAWAGDWRFANIAFADDGGVVVDPFNLPDDVQFAQSDVIQSDAGGSLGTEPRPIEQFGTLKKGLGIQSVFQLADDLIVRPDTALAVKTSALATAGTGQSGEPTLVDLIFQEVGIYAKPSPAQQLNIDAQLAENQSFDPEETSIEEFASMNGAPMENGSGTYLRTEKEDGANIHVYSDGSEIWDTAFAREFYDSGGTLIFSRAFDEKDGPAGGLPPAIAIDTGCEDSACDAGASAPQLAENQSFDPEEISIEEFASMNGAPMENGSGTYLRTEHEEGANIHVYSDGSEIWDTATGREFHGNDGSVV